MDARTGNLPIGVFDSGLGGLTVLREIHAALPGESTVYLGDTARVPYGIRSDEVVKQYVFQSARFLESSGIKLLVLACNTATSIALDSLRSNLSIPVVGVIEPGARAAVSGGRRRIGVIGTDATVNSGAYQRAIRKLRPEADVVARACPLFVPLAEEGWVDDEVAELTARRYLAGFEGIEALVLGCTHYPLLKATIGRVMGSVPLIDSAFETAREVSEILSVQGLTRTDAGLPTRRYCVTDRPQRFAELVKRFLGHPVEELAKVELN